MSWLFPFLFHKLRFDGCFFNKRLHFNHSLYHICLCTGFSLQCQKMPYFCSSPFIVSYLDDFWHYFPTCTCPKLAKTDIETGCNLCVFRTWFDVCAHSLVGLCLTWASFKRSFYWKICDWLNCIIATFLKSCHWARAAYIKSTDRNV